MTSELIKLTKGERAIILDRLYDRVAYLRDAYNNGLIGRTQKRRIRTERRALAVLINKLEGSQALNVETDSVE
jgi:hypothetical protein